VVAEQEAVFQSIWNGLTGQQQNVLRAVAADLGGLTTKASVGQFALSSSGSASNSARAMIDAGYLVKSPSRTGYSFENPFFGYWVRRATLADLGAAIPLDLKG
jgi:hypothetical protein